ncbi:hypothetical protein Pyn_27834 [Prunus yedoensis var. nudiflora]|uniref:Pyrrolo-quinoline quinone repeat domain-containing protein n=1 Tax=Prunus yedoensis var. nudiflora TaxID=2094558 RepID=A0A314ZFE1_PRUYE|nr:hypothetical protein Pyn_27834 [Prunus yedoensis var. nudiflora]
MAVLQSLVFLFLIVSLASTHSQSTQFQNYPAKEPTRRNSRRLSRPLIGHDGKVYTCSEKDLLAFESNGSIAWTMHLNYTCNSDMPPVHGGRRKMYLVADNRVIKINFLNNGTSEPAAEVLLSAEPTKEGQGGIVGLAVSTMSSSVFVNIKNRGLFAYMTRGQLLWSAGPVIDLFGYRQGCRKNSADCFFNSVPVIDECEASIYISNTGGELYSLSIRRPHFKWIQDLSSYDKVFTITPGNNGRLYVTVPVKALLLALDVSSGNVLWEGSIGPLSTADYTPVVDSNDMEGKISRTVGEYTYVSAMKPKSVLLTLYVPATGSIYWSESYPGQFSSFMSQSDLRHFILDERILLAFVAASKTGNPLACRSTRQKLMSSCSQVRPKLVSIYTVLSCQCFIVFVPIRKQQWRGGEAGWTSCEDKGKAPLEEEESSSDGGFFTRDYKKSPSELASSSRGFVNPLLGEKEWTGKKLHYEDEVDSEPKIMIGSRSLSLKRRRALSSTN